LKRKEGREGGREGGRNEGKRARKKEREKEREQERKTERKKSCEIEKEHGDLSLEISFLPDIFLDFFIFCCYIVTFTSLRSFISAT
jgi:hypothetical protein